jgi:hypothetical protein
MPGDSSGQQFFLGWIVRRPGSDVTDFEAPRNRIGSGAKVVRQDVRRLSRLIAVPEDVVKQLVDVIDNGRPYRLDIPRADSSGQCK